MRSKGRRAQSFCNFQEGRVALGRIAARGTADVLWHLDAVAGPGGSAVEPDPEYNAFRAWYRQRCTETHVGILFRLLACLELDQYGRISLDSQPEPVEEIFDQPAARLRYLCKELFGVQPDGTWNREEGMVDHYGQLFPDEVPDCEADVLAALEVDFSDPDQRAEGIRLLGEIKKWFAFAGQGMRLFRGDADEQAKFDEFMEPLLATAEAEKARLEAVAEGAQGTEEERAAARESLMRKKNAVETEICEYQDAIVERRQELERVLANLSRVGSATSASPSPSPASNAAAG